MKIDLRHVLLASALGCPAAAHAVALKTPPATLNPTKAYILVEYKRVPNPFAGAPLAPKYLPLMDGLSLARYDVDFGDVRGMGKAASRPLPGKRGPIEAFQNRPIVKTDEGLLFLHEVEPDTYVVLGWANTSFSLGSYRFEAKAGTVTDLGVVIPATDWPAGEAPQPQKLTAGKLLGAVVAGPFAKAPPIAPARLSFRPRGEGDLIPRGIPVDRLTPVSFERGATFGNYLGGLVNRIDGVNASAAPSAPGVPTEATP
jgi:hypothetical protein